jgi:ubiquinone/menaquinone biosynthesis C-methylase UbiE
MASTRAGHGPAKLRVRKDWEARAPAWTGWADHLEELAARLNAPLIEAARIAPGVAVLDLASGAGEPAISVARQAGDGPVVASDLVPAMLVGARARARARGLHRLSFAAADMERLPFASGSFDRVTCRFGIMFCPDVAAALAEARRVLRPGGTAAFMVWAEMAKNTLFEVVRRVGDDILGDDPFDDELNPFRFGTAGSLAAAMTAAGFAGVEERELNFEPRPPAGSRFWQPNLEMTYGERLAALDPAVRSRLEAAIEAAFEACREGDAYRLKARARIGAGRA